MAFGFFKKKEAYADRVFYNGHFYTMDPEVPWVDAVAVRDGKVMAVGSYSQMEDILADDTERVDLREKYVYPGFIDIHHSPVMKMMDENYTIVEEETEEAEEAEAKNIFASLEHAEVYEYLEDEEDGQVTVEVDAGEALGEDGGIVFEVEEEGEPAEELDDETEYFVDNSEFTAKVKETMESLSDHGYTAVLNLKTPNQIENEFTDSLIELYTEDQLRARFFGALYMNRPVPARLVKEVLSMRRTKCTEVGDMIRNEVLHLDLSPGNILWDKDGDGYYFAVVDINRMRFGKVTMQQGCATLCRLWGPKRLTELVARSYAQARAFDEEEAVSLTMQARTAYWTRYLGRGHTIDFPLEL